MATLGMRFDAARCHIGEPCAVRLARLLPLCALAAVVLSLGRCSREPGEPPDLLAELPSISAIQAGELLPSVKSSMDALYVRLAENPTDPALNGELAMLLHAHQLLELARPLYLRAHALDPDAFRWTYFLGVVDSARGQSASALAWFQETIALNSRYVPAQLATARGLLDKGDLVASERLYRRLLAQSPNLARALLGLGRVHAARGDTAEAVRLYEKACALHPAYAEARYALALALRELRRDREARRHLALYQQAPASGPPLQDPLLEEVLQQDAGANAYVRAGVESVNAGNLERGAQLLERAVLLNPRDEGANLSLLIAYGQMGQRARAADHYRKAVQVFPSSEDIHFNYATILARDGELAEASKLFEQVLEINPQHADGHASLGYIFEASGDLPSSVRHYRSALEHAPGNPTARFRLGRLALADGSTAEAIEHFEAALGNAREQKDQLLYGMATAYAMRGDLAEASRLAGQARATALSLGHHDLAVAIEADLASFEEGMASRQ